MKSLNHSVSNSGTQPPATDLFEKKWVRGILFLLIPGAVFVLISAGIRVSQYGIDHTIVVLCPTELVAGSTSAMRITLIDDQEGFFLPERVAAKLHVASRVTTLFDAEVMESGLAVARNFEIPKLTPGRARLEISVYFDGQRRVIDKTVRIVAHPQRHPLSYPSDTAPDVVVARAQSHGATIRVYPEGRGAPAGLSSLLFVQTSDDKNQPVSVPYTFELPIFRKGDTPKIVSGMTNHSGLDAFMINPSDLQYPIRVAGSEVEGTADAADTETASDEKPAIRREMAVLSPAVVYSGMKMDLKSPLVEKDRPVELTIQQLSGGESVYLDVFQGNQWIFSDIGWAGDDGKASFVFVPKAAGILRIQAEGSPLQFNRNVVVRHVYIKAPKETDRMALAAIAGAAKLPHREWLNAAVTRLTGTEDAQHINLLAAFALSRLYQGHSPLPTLVSSRKEDDAALNSFKKRFQSGLTLAILLLGGAVAVLIAVIAWQSAQRQRRLTQLIMNEDTDERTQSAVESNDADNETNRREYNDGRGSRIVSWIQIGTLFLVVIAAFAALALLVMTMSWDQMPGF